MTPEEYQRYKEAEKAHLRKLKELKKAVRTLERQESVRSAVEKVTEGQDLLDKQKDLVDELAMETARHEARLDIALDSAEDAEHQAGTEALEEELQRQRAQALVRQLKRQMGGEEEDRASQVETQLSRTGENGDPDAHGQRDSSVEASNAEGRRSTERPTRGRDDRPEKTIGRM